MDEVWILYKKINSILVTKKIMTFTKCFVRSYYMIIVYIDIFYLFHLIMTTIEVFEKSQKIKFI